MENEQILTMKNLFEEMGHPYQSLLIDSPVDVSELGFEVKSMNQKGEPTWELIKNIVRKESTHSYKVPEFDLVVSPLHKFWAKISDSEPHWVEATGLVDCSKIELFHETQGWVRAHVEYSEIETDILDIEVENSQCYYSNGVLSHNTMHGDPDITPGGKSIPYHATLRIRLSSGTQVKDGQGNVIGIHVIMTTKKNKVAPPFRKYEFDVIFGRGISEHTYIFDELRSHCEKNAVTIDHKDGKGNVEKLQISIEGVSAWRTLKVFSTVTGEVLIEKKFQKNNFDEIMADPVYKPFIDKAIEDAYIIHGGDPDSSGESPSEEEVLDES